MLISYSKTTKKGTPYACTAKWSKWPRLGRWRDSQVVFKNQQNVYISFSLQLAKTDGSWCRERSTITCFSAPHFDRVIYQFYEIFLFFEREAKKRVVCPLTNDDFCRCRETDDTIFYIPFGQTLEVETG